MDRRDVLRAVAALPLLRAALPEQAFAQAYPTRNITMIVPFPAGGQADLAARPVAQALERILGKSVIVDNRAGGAGGSVGNAAAARAEPDGYTLLMTLSSLAVLPEADRLFDRPVAYEVSQFMPIARVLADPTLLAVPTSAPWKTAQEFVEDAKKRPGQITYGSSGPYGTLHVAMEMFANSAGIKLLHVPFRGAGPALTALLSGTVQAIAAAPGTLKPQTTASYACSAIAARSALRAFLMCRPSRSSATRMSRCTSGPGCSRRALFPHRSRAACARRWRR
jgi:tripartite-type tricarboxylate transporter receptor subunit TctC